MFATRTITAALFALTAVSAAQASTFDYSYTFNSGDAVSGSFEGDLVGGVITNIRDIGYSYQRFGFTGSNYTHPFYGSDGASAYINIDLSSYDFQFVSQQENAGFSGSKTASFGTHFDTVVEVSPGQFDYNADAGDNGSFSVKAISAVPEPANAAMLLAGFGFMGFVAKRRKS